MTIPSAFQGLRLPAIAAPMFLTSGPDLVVEVSRSGLVGTFPALNQRTSDGFVDWMQEISDRLANFPDAAPWGVNLVVHRSNTRLEKDLSKIVDNKAPLVITSLGAARDVVEAVHSYGGLVFHDVISRRHAEKAAEAGVDGIIAVCAGGGGHAGAISPFALIPEIRSFFSGTIVLAGALSTGAHIAAARVAGADMAYLGTRFIATQEAMVGPEYKEMIIASGSADILYTDAISGVNANFMRASIVAAGLDPDALVGHGTLDLSREESAWKTIWSAGQGAADINDIPPTAELCDRLVREYNSAHATFATDAFVAG